MKNSFAFLFGLLFLGHQIQAQLVDVIVEEYGTSGGSYPDGYMTYRVYARLADPDDALGSVYGSGGADPDHPIMIGWLPGVEEVTTIWNSPFGATTGDDVSSFACSIIPETCYDSFITIGRANNGDIGGAVSIVSNSAGVFEPAFGNDYPNGSAITVNDGSWFGLQNFNYPTNCYGKNCDLRVLIMQVTCLPGTLKFALNIMVLDEVNSGNPQQLYYCHNLVDPPGSLGGVMEEDYTCRGLVYPNPDSCPQCNDPLACNFDPADLDAAGCYYDEDCDPYFGCVNPAACNYDPSTPYSYWESWGGCCTFPGCTDPIACNFESNAWCDDGTCQYSVINGNVFHDLNGDGILQTGFYSEQFMSGVEVILMPENISVFTDDEGYFEFVGLSEETHYLDVVLSDPSWLITSNLSDNLSGCQTQQIGIETTGYYLNVSGPATMWMTDIHCTNGYNPGIFVNNTGSMPFTGTVTITCDELFTFSELTGNLIVPPDVINPGEVIWYIDEQNPFSSANYQIHVIGPGEEFIGQTFPFALNLVLYDDMGAEFYNNTWNLEPTVICAYDPNDKYTAEPGYTEEHHFVLAEDEIEYRVRFQNTGNYPAEQVIIRDTLDLDHLDLASFYPVIASHNYMTHSEPSGAITFTFNNIMLPDSATDEPGSQGFVVYRVRPKSNVGHMDVITNTAHIFFDNNSSIITNTTWHTIMDCDALDGLSGVDVLCVNEMGYYTGPTEFVESYNWTLDNMPIEGNGQSYQLQLSEEGMHVIGLAMSNPLCEWSDEFEIEINSLPSTIVLLSDGVLTGPNGVSWQWFYEGSEIIGAQSQEYTPLQNGTYKVFVTNEVGCSGFSEEVIFVSISEIKAKGAKLYPNPVVDLATIDLAEDCSDCRIEIVDAIGRIVDAEYTTVGSRVAINTAGIQRGKYEVRIIKPSGSVIKLPMIVG